MHVTSPKGFSQFSGALSPISPKSFARARHPLPELPGETVERLLRHAKRFEALVGQSDAHPRVRQWTVGIGGRSHNSRNPAINSRPALRSSMRSAM